MPICYPFFSGQLFFGENPRFLTSLAEFSLDTGGLEILVSCFEGIAYSIKKASELLEFKGDREFIVIGGGLSRSNFLVTLQSTVFNRSLISLESKQLSSIGATFLSFSREISLESIVQPLEIEPNFQYSELIKQRYQN